MPAWLVPRLGEAARGPTCRLWCFAVRPTVGTSFSYPSYPPDRGRQPAGAVPLRSIINPPVLVIDLAGAFDGIAAKKAAKPHGFLRAGSSRRWFERRRAGNDQTGGTRMTRTRTLLTMSVAGFLALGLAAAAPAWADDILIGLITKTNTNPFFVKMKEGADAKAKELGVKLQSFAGKFDGDNDGQVAAVESLTPSGAKGILITPSDTKAIVPTIKKARDAGILVIALDTPLDPIDAADATFATDNFQAGVLIGEWAAKTLGNKAATAHVAFLDALEAQPTVDVARDQGFMKGFGIDPGDLTRYLDEKDARISGHQWG